MLVLLLILVISTLAEPILRFERPYKGQTVIYLFKHLKYWNLEYTVSMLTPISALKCSKVHVILRKKSSFPGLEGHEIFRDEFPAKNLYSKDAITPPTLKFDFSKDGAFMPFVIQEGYYEIVVYNGENKQVLGKSDSFMMLNGQNMPNKITLWDRITHGIGSFFGKYDLEPRERLVTGFAMLVQDLHSYKLYITRELKSDDIIEIYIAKTYRRPDGSAFLDRGKPVILDGTMTSNCQQAENVCNVPFPHIDYNMGVFFEIYHKNMFRRELQLRTRVYYKHTRDEVFEAVRESAEKVGDYVCQVAKIVVHAAWQTLRLAISMIIFLAMNMMFLIYSALGICILKSIDFLAKNTDSFLVAHQTALGHGVGVYKFFGGKVPTVHPNAQKALDATKKVHEQVSANADHASHLTHQYTGELVDNSGHFVNHAVELGDHVSNNADGHHHSTLSHIWESITHFFHGAHHS